MNLEDRVANLEIELAQYKQRAHRARWVSSFAIGICLLMFGFFEVNTVRLTAQDNGFNEEIRAKSFVLVDENNQSRGTLDFNSGGEPRLALHNESGETRLELSVTDGDDPSLLLLDKEGRGRVLLTVVSNNVSGLVLVDKNDKTRATLGISNDDDPGFLLYDGNNKIRSVLGIYDNEPGLIFENQNGKIIWRQP